MFTSDLRSRLGAAIRQLWPRPRGLAPRLAISPLGGLGDLVVYARFMRDLAAHVGPLSFDVYCNNCDAAQWAFQPVLGFGLCRKWDQFDARKSDYDLALRLSHFALVLDGSLVSPNVDTRQALNLVIDHVLQYRRRIEPLLQNFTESDSLLGQYAIANGYTRMTFLQAFANIQPGGEDFPLRTDERILARLNLTAGRYVTIHNGFDINANSQVPNGRATKCYPEFDAVVANFKRARPDIPMVQLGSITSSPISGVDYDLIGQSSIPEVAALLKNAGRHVDSESGLVHVARCFGTKCVVIFGPTPLEYFGYSQNQNLPRSDCTPCWGTDQNWMARCPRGYDRPICTQQDPSVIGQKIAEAF
jgi:hypothetical protein